MKKNYSIGLDIGNTSVGWAVMNEDYTIPIKRMPVRSGRKMRHTKKLMSGVLLFEEGKTAQNRRMKRTTRRRYFRRRYRLMLLQEIFKMEVEKVDSSFFHRLQESSLHKSDKTTAKHPIFSTLEDELAYHQKFPTIYHLREYLANSDEKVDIRLVYLAIAHIIKYRGHFLNEGSIEAQSETVQQLFVQFIEVYNRICDSDIFEQEVESILTAKISRTAKKDAILKLYPNEKKTLFGEFIKLIVGNVANFKSIFNLDEDQKLQFSSEKYDEEVISLLSLIGQENEELFEAAKKVYDAMILASILTVSENTNAPLSSSMVKRYDDHKTDLALFKSLISQYKPDLYKQLFHKNSSQGYSGYINNVVNIEDFYKLVKKVLGELPEHYGLLDKVEREDFLKKQRNFENGQIPHQLHLQELRAIILKQQKYYPFLNENLWKMEKLLTFRIPYYVGPLDRNQNSLFAWAEFKSNQPVTPYNFDEIVDKEQSAINFIDKMTVRDLYLPDKKVLPKHSLLYEQFVIYNELTKIRYIDDYSKSKFFDTDLKKSIVEKLFKVKRKVSKKDLLKFLANEHQELQVVNIIGLDEESEKFNATFETYHDLLKILDKSFLDDETNSAMIEDIIHTLTIFEDQEMIKLRLNNYASILSEKQIKQLSRRHYTGWGRLSKELINVIKDEHTNKTILDYLIDDSSNRNFMQLINDSDLSFKKIIEDEQNKHKKIDLVDIVDDIHGNPAIKKGILQSLKIVQEIVRVMGYPPTDIVVEMARENQTTQKGRGASKERLKKLESCLKELGSKIIKEKQIDNKQLQNTKIYLYCLQNGKDMYTKEAIDFDHLEHYDIDHIIPQSFIKDNSIDNIVLTHSNNNRGKSDNVPNEAIVKTMKGYWKILKDAGLISQRKWDNLTKIERGGLSIDDKSKFIKRQLVETRQI